MYGLAIYLSSTMIGAKAITTMEMNQIRKRKSENQKTRRPREPFLFVVVVVVVAAAVVSETKWLWRFSVCFFFEVSVLLCKFCYITWV